MGQSGYGGEHGEGQGGCHRQGGGSGCGQGDGGRGGEWGGHGSHQMQAQGHGHGHPHEQHEQPRGGCREGRGDDHDEQTRRSWDDAFWEAYKELQVEAIKAKLKETWGERMAQTAGEIVAAHADEYEAFQRQEAARQAYEKAKEELAKAYEAMKAGKAPSP